MLLQTNSLIGPVVTSPELRVFKLRDISEESVEDAGFLAATDGIHNDKWSDAAASFNAFATGICFQNNILLRGQRIYSYIPEWCPKMNEHIENFVRRCTTCTLVSTTPPPEPMKRIELPSAAWQHLAMEFLGPLPSGYHIFIIIDYFSRDGDVKDRQRRNDAPIENDFCSIWFSPVNYR